MGTWTRRQAQYAEMQGATLMGFTTGPDGRNTYWGARPLYQALVQDNYKFAEEGDDDEVIRESGGRPPRRDRYAALKASAPLRRSQINSSRGVDWGVLQGIENESGTEIEVGWFGDFDDLSNLTGLEPERLQDIYNGYGKAKHQRSVDELRAEPSFRIT